METIKRIKIEEIENGIQMFYVYEIISIKHNGERIISDIYLNEETAKEALARYDKCYGDLYKMSFIIKDIVWAN